MAAFSPGLDCSGKTPQTWGPLSHEVAHESERCNTWITIELAQVRLCGSINVAPRRKCSPRNGG